MVVLTLSELYPPACADLGTLRRLSDWRSRVGTCSGCRSAWKKVMVVQ
jgi:hypothetical protein